MLDHGLFFVVNATMAGRYLSAVFIDYCLVSSKNRTDKNALITPD